MPIVAANGISLAYEESGDASDPAMVLIMGLGQQLITWPERFVDGLVDAGFRVIRFDNRDAGQSTYFKGKRSVSPALLVLAARLGVRLPVPYTLTDMADDVLGLMDVLGVRAAHLAGVSMGGMIAQLVAVRAPERVLTLTSIMSSSGARGLPGAAPEVRARMFTKAPAGATREQAMERTAETLTLIATPDAEASPGAIRAYVERAAARGYNPGGVMRQMLAILADGSRVRRLARIKAPTLVVHGEIDNLIPVACGIDTARHIPGARLEVIEQMSHDLPPSQIPRLVSLLAGHAGG